MYFSDHSCPLSFFEQAFVLVFFSVDNLPERIALEMEIDLVVAICFWFEDLEVLFVEEDCLAFDGLVFALFAFFSEVFVESCVLAACTVGSPDVFNKVSSLPFSGLSFEVSGRIFS